MVGSMATCVSSSGVHMLAFAGALGVAQRSQDRHRGVHAGEQVGHGHAHLLRPPPRSSRSPVMLISPPMPWMA